MQKTNNVLLLMFLIVLSVGCSSSDDSNPGNPIIFNGFTVSKTHSFIEDVITLEVDGEGFTDIIVTADNPDISIQSLSTTTFEISASEANRGIINVELVNGSNAQSEIKAVNFYEHGIQDFKIVEGIETGVDNISKVIELLGEPEDRFESILLVYLSKGLIFLFENDIVIVSTAFGSMWRIGMDEDFSELGSIYPYPINEIWNFTDNRLTMTDVVNSLGDANTKSETPNNNTKTFRYSSGVEFEFTSESLDDFQGKEVGSITFN